MIREALLDVLDGLVRVRWPEARRDYHPLPPGVTTGPGVPLRAPQVDPDDDGPVDATDEERARWAEGERVCRKAFGVPDWWPAP